MKKRTILSAAMMLWIGSLLCMIGACEMIEPLPEEEEEGPAAIGKIYEGSSASPKYIDLEDPDNPLSSGEGTAWDILIEGKELLTNSGTTAAAESSEGTGGVVYAGTSNFSDSMSRNEADDIFEDAAASSGLDKGVDFSYYSKYKTSSATPSSSKTGNAASFPGYVDHDGRNGSTAATAWVFGEVGAHVDVDFNQGTAYAKWEMMAPAYSEFNNRVYVVRSGDGSSYYKIQIREVVYTSPSIYTFSLKFIKL